MDKPKPIKDALEAVETIRYGLLDKIYIQGQKLTNTETIILDICNDVLEWIRIHG